MAAVLLCLGTSAVASAADPTFTVTASGGAHRQPFTVDEPWAAGADVAFTGAGTVSLVLTDARTGSFVATATRWAPLGGQAPHSDNVTVFSTDPTFKTWSLPAGRYLLTVVCDSRCAVTFRGRPRGFGPSLLVSRSARHTHVWTSAVQTAGVPGGAVTHPLPGDLHGALLASVGASARYTLMNVQTADVCLVSDEPLCGRTEDGEGQQRTWSLRSELTTDSTYRMTRIYPQVDGAETTVHRITMTQALDARATVIFVGR